MKTFCLTTMIVLLLSGSFGIVNAQNVKEKACLDNTEQFYLTSNYVKGENYRIQVSLPLNYAASKEFYPVYYFADRNNSLIHECKLLSSRLSYSYP